MVCIVLHVLNIHMSPVDGRQSIEAPAWAGVYMSKCVFCAVCYAYYILHM